MGIAETMRLMKRGRDFVRTWRRRAPEVRKHGNVYSRRKGRVGETWKTQWCPKGIEFFNGSAIILSYNVNKTSYLWDNYSQWNILKHVFMFGTMNTIHREHPVTFSGCFMKTFVLVFWSLQKFLMKIWIPSKLSQHNFQLLFRDSIFSWENVVWTREKMRLVCHTSYFST